MLLSAYSGHYCLVHPTSAFKNGGGVIYTARKSKRLLIIYINYNKI